MLNIRKITRQEWNQTPKDYRGITTILVCRHCGAWTFKSRPDLIPAECASAAGHEWDERRQKTMLARDQRGATVLELVEVVNMFDFMDELNFVPDMTEQEFAELLGFDSYESLMEASESVAREGDIDWFITQLPDGRWAAWDDAELEWDRVEYFDTREEAEAFHVDAYADKYGEE